MAKAEITEFGITLKQEYIFHDVEKKKESKRLRLMELKEKKYSLEIK